MSPKSSLAVSPKINTGPNVVVAPRPTILVAEDSADSREMMQVLLEIKGYRVLSAADGVRALDAAIKNRPDAVLLDLQLPRLDGLAVARNLRLQPIFEHLPIIMVSGHDPDRYQPEAIAAGCDEYLLKPLNFNRLQVVLDRLVPRGPRAQVKSA